MSRFLTSNVITDRPRESVPGSMPIIFALCGSGTYGYKRIAARYRNLDEQRLGRTNVVVGCDCLVCKAQQLNTCDVGMDLSSKYFSEVNADRASSLSHD